MVSGSEEILHTITLTDGRRVVVLDWKSEIDAARNLLLVDRDGRIIWRVSSQFDSDGGPFTQVEFSSNGKLSAYRWDGGSYQIDMQTGFATPMAFEK